MAIQPCRLRKFRKSAHVSQRELAFLVGLHSQGVMSEIEGGMKRPGVGVAIACEVAFGVSIAELFPALDAEVLRDVLANARTLHAELEPNQRRAATTAFLAALISRLGGTNP